MTEIIGHKLILDFFDKVIEKGNLSHAYCLVGPEMVGKRTVAEFVAGKLLQTDSKKLNINPDFSVTEQLFDEKTSKTKKDITVVQMRELRQNLARHSYSGGYKVAIIDKAEKMNSEAANALLKTLEEPTEKTILFLLTRDESLLPRTILSRCQTVYFQPVAKDLLKNKLIDLGVEDTRAESLATMAHGLPGQAIFWHNNPDEYDWYNNEINRFCSLLGKTFHEKISLVEDLFGDKIDHIATRDKLQNILGLWQILIRDIFYTKNNLENYSVHKVKKYSENFSFYQLSDSLVKAGQMLNQNIHPRLLVENILLRLP